MFDPFFFLFSSSATAGFGLAVVVLRRECCGSRVGSVPVRDRLGEGRGKVVRMV
jgi:hypothetical protein